ncbi:MAG: redoxin domain-containing protein [Beijerinckiaceae bacterium]
MSRATEWRREIRAISPALTRGREIAKVLFVDNDTICSWFRLFKEDGIDGLARFGPVGSACQLNGAQQEKLKAWIAAAGASVIGISGDKIEVQRDFSNKECRDKFPVGAGPGFSVIKAYDAALNVPLAGAAFANRISYVISPEGMILYAYSDSGAEKHIENTLAAVRKWREEQKP